jgi:hypothetical protein
MAFKASKAKSGLFEIHGLEAFIEKKFAELKKAFGIPAKVAQVAQVAPVAPKVEEKAPGKKAAAAKKAAPAKKASVPAAKDPLAQVLAVLSGHPRKAELIKAGKQKDQLLRSLIPLYLSRGGIDVSSGVTSKFWAEHGITYAAPNAAKALREHVGYARRTKSGQQITPNGIKYVEQALAGKNKAA